MCVCVCVCVCTHALLGVNGVCGTLCVREQSTVFSLSLSTHTHTHTHPEPVFFSHLRRACVRVCVYMYACVRVSGE